MKHGTRWTLATLLSIGTVFGSVWSPLVARADDQEVHERERARTFLLMRLTEELDLPDEKAIELARVLRTMDDRRQVLRLKRRDIEEKIQTALGKHPPDTAALPALIKDGNAIDNDLAMLQEQVSLEAQKVLTVEQQAQLLLLRPRLQQEVRNQRPASERISPPAHPDGRPAPDRD